MKTRITVGLMGLTLAGCSTTPPANDQVQIIEKNCAVILSESANSEQRQSAYNQLIESYGERYVDANNPKQSTNWDLFRQNVIHDEKGQLTREFIEVSDWGCANGNYLEEVHLFVEEAQTSGL
ncbi:hypothetical protein [Vibrio campbellii]|uniref:hypothetical protein n=1 Tax=Vibrio campbellii TaxID=680 RepID=UPI0005EDC404|nr:hypothetical protein [Vibrio campbellii]